MQETQGLRPNCINNSQVVVELELVGVGAQPQRLDLVGPLVLDPGLNEVRSEDVALGEEVVVLLQGLQRWSRLSGSLSMSKYSSGASS